MSWLGKRELLSSLHFPHKSAWSRPLQHSHHRERWNCAQNWSALSSSSSTSKTPPTSCTLHPSLTRRRWSSCSRKNSRLPPFSKKDARATTWVHLKARRSRKTVKRLTISAAPFSTLLNQSQKDPLIQPYSLPTNRKSYLGFVSE